MSRSITMQAFEAYVAKRVELGDPPKVAQWSLLSEPLRAAWEAALEVSTETVEQLRSDISRLQGFREELQRANEELARQVDQQRGQILAYEREGLEAQKPVPMLLWCPECGQRHVDRGKAADDAHHTHACQACGHVWKPAKIRTIGVQFLPGYRDDEA